MPEKPHSNAPDLIESENGTIAAEPNEIAESFNEYFCSIGKKLAAKISNQIKSFIILAVRRQSV